MDINQYFNNVNSQSQSIFTETLKHHEGLIAESHYLTSCIFDYTEEIVKSNDDVYILKNAISQLETSIFCLTIGLYRQSYSCLRLSFELILGSVHYSINRLEYLEWQQGKQDIKWHNLIDKVDGILSKRFTNAFNADLTEYVESFNERASTVYRSLSEFVHGNNETWTKSGLQLKYNETLIKDFFYFFKEISEIIFFSLSARYLKSINKDNLDFLLTELSHIEHIRVYMGGPK